MRGSHRLLADSSLARRSLRYADNAKMVPQRSPGKQKPSADVAECSTKRVVKSR